MTTRNARSLAWVVIAMCIAVVVLSIALLQAVSRVQDNATAIGRLQQQVISLGATPAAGPTKKPTPAASSPVPVVTTLKIIETVPVLVPTKAPTSSVVQPTAHPTTHPSRPTTHPSSRVPSPVTTSVVPTIPVKPSPSSLVDLTCQISGLCLKGLIQ